jgi:alanine racemase
MVEKASHSTRVIIHAGHLVNNLRVLAARTSGNVRKMSVVKADAYGHGAVTVSLIADPFSDWFGVASTEEAVELRDAGIVKPILVFGVPIPENAALYSRHNLTAVIGNLDQLDILPAGTAYHIKFDTGMGRLGFLPEQAGDVLNAVQSSGNVIPEGIMSHLATSSDPGSEKVTEQIELFKSIRSQFPDHLITHIANSGGLLHYPDSHFDMVRHGISMYGYSPGERPVEGLKPALSWEASVVQCRRISKGQTVSYGARWTASENGYLLTVPVGYADGIPRLLSGKFNVLFNGMPLEQTGTVTMDYIMLYSKLPVKPGPMAIQLLDTESHHAGTWAQILNTIPYEIVCGISPKIKRLVISGG